jgi:fructokinase
MMYENFHLADIVRASHDDFDVVFGINNSRDAFNLLKQYSNAILFFTKGADKVEFMSESIEVHLPAPKIKVVSTIGAGDTFNAGLVYSLLNEGILKSDLPELRKIQLESILKTCISCSQKVCGSFDNYIPIDFGKALKRS